MKCILLLMGFLMLAQDKTADLTTSTEPKKESEEIIGIQEAQPGEFVYQPRGRKDPFWNPLRGTKETIRDKKMGIAGLTIAELTLEGIFLMNDKFNALFKGPEGRPYYVKLGDNVYDGEVIAIEKNVVVFRQQLPVVLTGQKEKVVKKFINPEEEEVSKNEE